MRKTLLVIATLFITAQVCAAAVTIEVNDVGDGWAAIRYSADANVSAFGLEVTADSGAIFTAVSDYNVGECTASVQGYGIFPGTIDINESTGEVDGNGTPVAPNDDPGAEGTGLDTNTLILEMGALYVEGNEPALSGTLIKVQVDKNCRVCVEGEPIRGNIVMTDGTAVEANDCEDIVVGCYVPNVVGMASWTAAVAAIDACGLVAGPYGTWTGSPPKDEVMSQAPSGGTLVDCGSTVTIEVSRGPQPPNPIPNDGQHTTQYNDAATYITNHWDPNSGSGGWGKKYHCYGDAMGNTEVFMQNFRVYSTDLALLIANWGKKMGPWPWTGCNPAADVDHKPEVFMQNFRAYSKDLTRIICYWGKKDVNLNGEPQGACPWTDAVNNAWACPW
jgi:hypothetical protein